ncbi:hypothetical protein [Chishuiella sp.]|uniref:hypothetical protein n=1 Tax=Chishuiella sp. TaxID=1969467 RepID=UPI0028A7B90D|nr:hypothetical protein [Chishuiella sp.]
MKKNNYRNASLRKKVLARRLNKHHEANIPLNILSSMSLKDIRNAFNSPKNKIIEVPRFVSWDDINKHEKQIEELFKMNNKIV